MPYLSPPQNGAKPPSRFSSLNVLKLHPTSSPRPDAAPPPPPKDSPYSSSPSTSLSPSSFYNKPFFSRSAASLLPSFSSSPATPSSPYPPMPSLCLEFGKRSNNSFASTNGRTTAASPVPSASGGSLKSVARAARDYPHSPSMDGSSDSSGSSPSANSNASPGVYILDSANSSSCAIGQAATPSVKSKKSVFKLTNLAKRNKSKKDLSETASASGSGSRTTSVSGHQVAPEKAEGDEGITLPWNFQHHIHVDEGYIGLPPSWSTALSQVGFSEDEIASIHARRRAAATGLASSTDPTNSIIPYSTERSASPKLTLTPPDLSTSASSSTTLLEPLPRSTSLGKGQGALKIHSPSMYSVASSSTAGPSPAPSPRTPSFSMKSLVSGIKNSLTSDSASTKEDVAVSRSRRRAAGEESDQYVFVDGDGPDEDENPGMGDETLIEPYLFDSPSVSSHHAHASRLQQAPQDQQTPRTPSFPQQIQLSRTQSEAAHVSFPSPHASSALSHSVSLPIPTPPRGYTYIDHSTSSSPSRSDPRRGPLSAPPRTPAKRIYHVVNSTDSDEGENYVEPPPSYASLKKEGRTPKKEKEMLIASGVLPPPNRPIPPLPAEQSVDEPSGVTNRDKMEKHQELPITDDSNYTTDSSVDDIPRTADEILDISSYYSDIPVHERDAEMDPRVSSPLPVVDGRTAGLAFLPPRISFHQGDSLEDWSESLFTAIRKRSSVRMSVGAQGAKEERRTTIRAMSPLSSTSGGISASASNSSSTKTMAPSLPDISFGANLTHGSHRKSTKYPIEEYDGRGRAEEDKTEKAKGILECDAGAGEQVQLVEIETTTAAIGVEETDRSPSASSSSLVPGVSLDPNIPSLGKDREPPTTPSTPPESPRKTDDDSPPPPPPPKSKPTLIRPTSIPLTPPKTNIITGVSGRSPVNALFGAKPHPLPIPISLSQIRAQLRPAPPKSPHSSPTLPLPPFKRIPSQPNLQSLFPSQLPSTPSSPRKAITHDSTVSQASPSDSRPNSSHTLHPTRVSPGDRDSGLSVITVTPATITTAKTEVVRTAVASVVGSGVVSLASRQESVVSTADTEPQVVTYDDPDIGGESPRSQKHGEEPDDSLVSDGSSASLLHDDPQSKWPAPPPPPVKLETDSTPRRISRFRTTSLGRVTQLQAMGGTMISHVGSHSPHGSSETMSTSSSESTPLTTPDGADGVSLSVVPRKGASEAKRLSFKTSTYGDVDMENESGEDDREIGACLQPCEASPLESYVSMPPATHPLLAQLQPHISPRNPASCFTNLIEIAEGESGSVFAARVLPPFAGSRPHGQEADTERPIPPGTSHVAIKRIPLPRVLSSPSLTDDSPVSNKLVSVLHELCLLKGLDHEHLLLLDAVYAGSCSTEAENAESASAIDTSLWIRMELMERSLADVIALVAEGLPLQERLIARFANDILDGLDYLQRQHIAHRDVRSDNLLVNASGVVKLADFSNAIRVDRNSPTVKGAVGVIYWQAPEMRAGPYNALKVDIWSLGATVWELAETIPPFSMPASPSSQVSFAIQASWNIGSQWPSLTHPEHYSRGFHEFLKLCGRDSATRPGPGELLNTQFIRNACGRTVILQLLSQCRAIEEAIALKEA